MEVHDMTERIGFIGLGRMGQAMASNLIEAGYSLCVYNRTPSKAAALVARGARLADRPS
jgi:3-hydroxyisobutyrate dehydrogenase